jgi:uncharacterized repeat protein (TIGR03806 family)
MRIKLLSVCLIALCGVSMFSFTPASHPAKLSDWNLFTGKLSALQPAKGVVPYQLNTPLFSDYSEKLRFVKLPPNTSVQYQAETVLSFPEGTMLIKNFYYPSATDTTQRKLIETRLLINREGNWVPLTYVWSDDQSDAYLTLAGDEKEVSWKDANQSIHQVRYVVPNQNQCKGCHNVNESVQPIGPSVRQLNGTYAYATGTENQLSYWSNHGMLSQLPALSTIPATPVWNDASTGSLDARARAYLAINCAHCHRREGPAQTSGLFLTELENNPTAIGINKTPVAAGKGSGGREYDIVPGNAEQSILYYRMLVDSPGERMPELGRTGGHREGLALIKNWINQMRPTEKKSTQPL